ncbi:MAG: cyanoglobin [Polyangiaceae bacterium]|mgnify:CR=1 FL=1
MAPDFAPDDMPFHRLGGEARVRELAARFYAHMDDDEPALARLHELDAQGRVSAGVRERFAAFLVEWLGGPMIYSPVHGHPRLRMRHARVRVDTAMRDAWLRCMASAMDDLGVSGEVRTFLDGRFAEVADFLRNAPDTP